MDFVGSHILSVDQFDRADIERVFAVADDMRIYADRSRITRVLQGAILSSMFFEPSTRTRVSFGCAFNLLGGDVRETTEVKASSLAKGESLYDTARVLSGYSDIIVMRHPEAGSVAEFAAASRVPVLNGGDGPNEHPSQALLDLYTIQNEMQSRGKGIDGLRIALVGDLKYGRAVHSLCKLLGLYNDVHYRLVSPAGLGVPEHIRDDLRSKGHEVLEYDELEAGIHNVDILYVTRTQEERFPTQEDADRYRGLFRLNNEIY
ncbi:MAG: aspartate carbamoyltransferase, partial [Pseudomonadota bacterium]